MKRGEDLERLDDYVRGVGTDADAASFEADLFTRALAGEARELVTYDALTAMLRELADRGTFMSFISAKDAMTLRSRYGDRMVLVEVPAGPTRQTVVLSSKAEIMVARTAFDLRDVERVDVEAHVEGVGLVKTMPDVTFDAADGALYACCEMDLARQTVGMPVLTKYWGTGPSGRRLLGEVSAIVELA